MVAGGGAQRNHRIDATNQFPPRRGGRIQGMRLKQLRSVLPSLRDGRRVGWGVIRWFRIRSTTGLYVAQLDFLRLHLSRPRLIWKSGWQASRPIPA